MEYVKPGQKVLYVWGGEVNTALETQINELKAAGIEVNVENIDRLRFGKFSKFYLKHLLQVSIIFQYLFQMELLTLYLPTLLLAIHNHTQLKA